MEIIKVVREYKPDLLLAVGGGSVLDATKFISAAASLDPSVDAWDIISKGAFPEKAIPVGSIITLPATGSEWNNTFVISREDRKEKNYGGAQITYPKFSIIDPRYTMTLPQRQIRNGLFDAMIHCTDQVITGDKCPMADNFFFSVMKELVDISTGLLQPDASLELHERLIVASEFAQNQIFAYGKTPYWEVHLTAQPLTPMYGIDHAATLAIVAPVLYERLKESRKETMAEAAEYVFGVHEGTVDQKADKFIEGIRNFAIKLGMPLKVSDFPNASKIQEGDVKFLVERALELGRGQQYGYNNELNAKVVEEILSKVVQ